jgi:hypothetical protein
VRWIIAPEDYELLVEGNRKLISQHDQLKHRCESLQAEAHCDAEKQIADLQVRVRSAEAHRIDVAAKGEKKLRDFEGALVQKMEGLHQLYADNVWTIGDLCSLMPVE